VAPNPWSLAQALAEPAIAWPRAIVAGSEVVGFLMLEIDPHDPHGRPFWLWRLMIGAAHQRQGMGTAALAAAVDEVRARGGTELYTSWVPGQGGPEPFYRHLGFHPTARSMTARPSRAWPYSRREWAPSQAEAPIRHALPRVADEPLVQSALPVAALPPLCDRFLTTKTRLERDNLAVVPPSC
jgi:diamine N-acetyltransferase